MRVQGISATAFGTKCYILTPVEGSQAVVIDPGIGVLPGVEDHLNKHQLKPSAVVLTHGHVDHTYSVAALCRRWEIPAYIHQDDASLLEDPLPALSTEIQILLGSRGEPYDWQRPEVVHTFSHNDQLELAQLQFRVLHCPGHTPGASVLLVTAEARPDQLPLCFSGDVLFCGSIGRTDLPQGDHAAMQHSLVEKILPLPDDMVVYPGHGPDTTIGMERMVNPYLRQVAGLSPYEPEV